jgi:hypothetical protein
MPNNQRGGDLRPAQGIGLAILLGAGFWLVLIFFL